MIKDNRLINILFTPLAFNFLLKISEVYSDARSMLACP